MAPTAPPNMKEDQMLTILHFNDVYNIESGTEEPVGGAARFCTALKSLSHLNPLVLFSGDIFAPSFMSTFTKGEQMVPVLNACGVHCSVFGNHDFDFGIELLEKRAKETETPWLMSNVINNETGKPLADGRGSLVIDWQGIRVGLIGLVEKEWLDTLAAIDPGHVTYTDYVDCGRLLARNLKEVHGCRLIIALTHMRTPNDERLAKEVEEIDLILGGHDHVAEFIQVDDRFIVKSGTDFRQFSRITLTMTNDKPIIELQFIDVTSDFEEDTQLKAVLERFTTVVGEKMDEVLGTFGVPLDGRFSSIRTSETNLGNFVCDIMVAATDSDLALLNSGTLRSDRIHPPGPFSLRDLHSILPMLDPLIVIEISGQDLLTALENSVSQYPKLEGRFLQIGGMSFAFDPKKPSGQRVDPRFVRIGDQYLEPLHMYRAVCKAYMCAGKDGYDVLKKQKILVDEEESIMLTTAVQNHFYSIASLRGSKGRRSTHHRQSLVTLSRRHSLARTIETELLSQCNGPNDTSPQSGTRLRRRSSVDAPNISLLLAHSNNGADGEDAVYPKTPSPNQSRKIPRLQRQSSIDEIEWATTKLQPIVDGRIVIIDDKALPELTDARVKWETTRPIDETIEQ